MSRYMKPNNVVINHFPHKYLNHVQRYLRSYHRNSWYQFESEPNHNGDIKFRSTQQIFNCVFAFVEGLRMMEKELVKSIQGET